MIEEKLQQTIPLDNGIKEFVYSHLGEFPRMIHCNICMIQCIPANALFKHDEQDSHVDSLSYSQNIFIKSAEIYERFRTFCNTFEDSRFRRIANDTQQCILSSEAVLEIESGGFICIMCRKEHINDAEVVDHLKSSEHIFYFVVSFSFVLYHL